MRTDISPKVLNPIICLAACGGVMGAVGATRSNARLRQAGAILLAASGAAGVIGWESRDPLRIPYIEPAFEAEPELDEHRARAQTG